MSDETIIERFEAVTEVKLICALDKMFNPTNNTTETDAANMDNCIVVDPSHVILCIAKTEKAKRILSRFVDKNNVPKIPNFDFELEKGQIAKSLYSTDFLGQIYNVLKQNGNHLILTMGIDKPIKIENEEFEFWLAPRIEDE